MRIPQREAVRRPRPPQTAKHQVEQRVRASTAASSRDEALLKGLPIAAANKSGETPAHLWRGPPQMHKALPSSACFSQNPLENDQSRWPKSGMPHRSRVALCARPPFSYPVSNNKGIRDSRQPDWRRGVRIVMSSLQVRRADRMMSDERALET